MLRGSVALVTGGASGLGRATVERFVREGAKVAMLDLPTSNGEEEAAAVGSKDDVFFAPVDVTSEEDVTRALEETKKRFGRLDAAVNCAGIGVAFKIYNFNKQRAHDLNDFAKVLHVNTTGTFNVAR